MGEEDPPQAKQYVTLLYPENRVDDLYNCIFRYKYIYEADYCVYRGMEREKALELLARIQG